MVVRRLAYHEGSRDVLLVHPGGLWAFCQGSILGIGDQHHHAELSHLDVASVRTETSRASSHGHIRL